MILIQFMIEMISLETSSLNSKELTLAGVLVLVLFCYVNLRFENSNLMISGSYSVNFCSSGGLITSLIKPTSFSTHQSIRTCAVVLSHKRIVRK